MVVGWSLWIRICKIAIVRDSCARYVFPNGLASAAAADKTSSNSKHLIPPHDVPVLPVVSKYLLNRHEIETQVLKQAYFDNGF